MANNLTAKISADTSSFLSAIDKAKQSLSDWVKETKAATEEGKAQAGATEEQVRAYERVISKLSDVGNGSMSAAKQQAALRDQIKELTTQWHGLSEAAKEGAFGQSLAQTLGEAKKELSEIAERSTKAKEETAKFFDDISKKAGGTKGVYRGLSEEGKKFAEMFKSSQGEAPLKKQLKQLQTELTILTDKWRTLSEEEKETAQGQELARYMDDLRERAGSLKDTIGDVGDEIKVLASDTPNLDVFNELLGLSADALQTYSGIIAKVTGNEEAFKNMLSTVVAVQGAANFATKLTNALQSSSAVMLKIRTIQEAAAATAIRIRAAAEGKGTLAVKAATIAQAAFNLVAKANPYVLLATAVLGAVGIIYGFSKALENNAEAQETAKKKAEALKAEQEEQAKQTQELNDVAGDTSTKFLLLKSRYEDLKTTAEKTQFIKDNSNAFSDLGLSVNSVTDAENAFVNNTDAVLNALLQRAIAAKRADQIADQIAKLRSKKSVESGDYRYQYENHEADLVDNQVMGNGKKGRQVLNEAGVKTSEAWRDKNNGKIHLTQSAKDKLKRYSEKEAKVKKDAVNKEIEGLTNEYKGETKKVIEANKILKPNTPPKHNNMYSGRGGGKGGKTTPPKKTEPEKQKSLDELISEVKDNSSVEKLSSIISEINKQLEGGLIKGENVEKAKNAIKELNKKLEEEKLKIKIEPDLDLSTLEGISGAISKKQEELNKATTNEGRVKIQKEIDDLTKKKENIEITLKPIAKSEDVESYFKQISEFREDRETKETDYSNTLLSGNKTEKKLQQYQHITESLKEQFDFSKNIVQSFKEQAEQIQRKKNLGATISGDESKILSIYEEQRKKVEELSAAYEDAAKNQRELSKQKELGDLKFEGMKEGISLVGSLNSSISGVLGTWQNLGEELANKDPFEQLTSVIGAVIDTLNSGISTYENITKVIEIFAQISEAADKAKIQSNQQIAVSEGQKAAATASAASQVITSNAAETASSASVISSKSGEAIAGATASGAKMPFPYNLIAIAAGITAVIGAISMIGKFAEGGIIQGTSVGDLNLARVNGGEMILNTSQQGRLFRLLNGEGSTQRETNSGGQVNFRISGADLVGVLSNHRTRTSKVL